MTEMLSGVLVVALEQAVAAPLCSQRLAEAGARVIKVERESGDFARAYDDVAKGESTIFVWLNRGKESLVVDIKQPADAALLQRMLARADVFIQNLAPGAAQRAGLDSAQLRAKHPRLITCDMSGYGTEGPYAQMRAYDMLLQAESGLASVTGTPDAPGRIGVSACDVGTGMNAVSGILQALYHRERTGEGSALSVSMFDSMADWMAYHILYYDYGGRLLPRSGLNHPLIAPYGAYTVKDGGQLLIAVQNEREWARFAAHVLEKPELAAREQYRDNSARVEHSTALNEEIGAVFATLEREQLEARLREHQIAYGRINTVVDVSAHSALRRVEVDTAGGVVNVAAPPLQFAGRVSPKRRVPTLGEHSAAIRAEFAQ
ncbi:MAG: CaiB/BaiF CoA-transferase family protein [SAR324 cluster bacterium]|nr:CaiB/BaiF CoA-transferase family protein [SAR324 cluster bacterium]